jgi:hypothetical protein
MVMVPLLAVGNVGATASVGTGMPLQGALPAVDPATSAFHSVVPSRIMDTRIGVGGSRFSAAETRTLTVGGSPGIPESGVVAVAVNVTAVNATTGGYITVWPTGPSRPTTSNLNFVANEVRANAVVTGVSSGGEFSLFNANGAVDVIVDLTGWFSDDFVGVTPTRLLDTRNASTFGSNESRTLQIAGQGGVASAGATAVAITVTVTNPSTSGYLAVVPAGAPPSGTSSLNYDASATVASTVVVGLGTGGGISIFNAGGSTDVLVDVMGYFSGGIVPLQPTRLLDTRDGTGQCGLFLDWKETRTLTVAGRAGVPVAGVGAVALNFTVTAPAYREGFLTAWPTGSPRPNTSNVNYRPGQTVANSALIGLGTSGQISISNDGGPTEVIIDVIGFFPGTTPGGTPIPCPPLTNGFDTPVAGRRLPDGTISTTAFNATLDALGPTAAVATLPLQLAIALSGDGTTRSTVIRSGTPTEELTQFDVTIDAGGFLDDSTFGFHSEVRLIQQADATYRVTRATWGYICYRRTSPPFTTELCP